MLWCPSFRIVAQLLLLLQLFLCCGLTSGANVPGALEEEFAHLNRGWLDCRSLSPPVNETVAPLPVYVKGKSFMDLGETLTSLVTAMVPELTIAKDVLYAFKFMASFFGARQNVTTVQADYWALLQNQVEFMIENKIDNSILSATSSAVTRMKADMETYIEHSKFTKDWSAILLTLKMDTTFNDILSDYYGVLHKEKSFLQYLDMATARMVLWQTTALRYIQELGLNGQTPLNNVCDIVLMWRDTYEFEMERVKKDLIPAMDTWRKNWESKMQLVCRETCDDYWGWGWDKYIDCYVRDGYNGHNYPKSSYQCTHNTCWSNVCNQFCSNKVSEQQDEADATYLQMMTVPDTFVKNMEQLKTSKMYDYVNECEAGSPP
ncbi:uncharacterized protein LOC143027761 [Oratosquilla oratoria]|uniref:uncharacterized protein LOC143027761 n=1 Tax=Oratosquilla oratoria TaxID=337810 RepID=UPI003F7775FD